MVLTRSTASSRNQDSVPSRSNILTRARSSTNLTSNAVPAQNQRTNQNRTTTMNDFITDPYQGDINPADEKFGLRLFLSATEPRPAGLQFTVSQDKAKEILQAFEKDSTSYAWGELVHKVPVSVDNSGNDVKKSIIRNYTEVTLHHVKQQALKLWGNKNATLDTPFPGVLEVQNLDPANDENDRKLYFLQVRSRMIAKRIEGSITPASWNSLLQKSKDFAWMRSNGNIEYDGPTMLKIIIATINPTTRVGVSDVTLEIQNARLNKYNFDVKLLLDDMNNNYQSLLRQNHEHPNFILDLFQALLSAKNDEFRDYIQRLKDEWEAGKDIQPEVLMESAISKYNNMKKQNTWGRINPKDAKIVALATELRQIKSCLSTSSNHQKSSDKKKPVIKLNIEKWRMHKKEDKKEHNGNTWWWCPHHKLDGHFDGLYMNHPPHKHDDWVMDKKKRRDEYKKKKSANKNSFNSSYKNKTPKASSNNLQLSEKMRSALVSNFQCSDAEAEAVWSEMSQNFGSA